MRFFSSILLTAPILLLHVIVAAGSQSLLQSLDAAPVLHFTLARRGGSFVATEANQDYVNFTYLTQELERIQDRFSLTRRVVKGNKLVRKARSDDAKGSDEGALMGDIADDGSWFVTRSVMPTEMYFLC